jgi:hypothetical protein
LVLGSWSVHGPWSVHVLRSVHGPWSVRASSVAGAECLVPPSRTIASGQPRTTDSGRTRDSGPGTQGLRTRDQGRTRN